MNDGSNSILSADLLIAENREQRTLHQWPQQLANHQLAFKDPSTTQAFTYTIRRSFPPSQPIRAFLARIIQARAIYVLQNSTPTDCTSESDGRTMMMAALCMSSQFTQLSPLPINSSYSKAFDTRNPAPPSSTIQSDPAPRPRESNQCSKQLFNLPFKHDACGLIQCGPQGVKWDGILGPEVVDERALVHNSLSRMRGLREIRTCNLLID